MPFDVAYIDESPNRAVREAYHALAANIHLINSKREGAVRTLTITSCKPKEGKTALATGLAIAMAQAGWRTLLVNANLREPSGAKSLSENLSLGFADYLAEEISFDKAVSGTNIARLSFLSQGLQNRFPVELLCSKRFSEMSSIIEERYDFTVFDVPALGTVVDAEIVAAKTSATILVVRSGYTALADLQRAKSKLESLDSELLGVVLNKVKKT